MTKNQILVQNIETFATITRLTVDVESGETATERIDQYFAKNDNWGIVSLDDDADGEYMQVMLVAPVDGPDYDAVTQEPVVDAAAELEAKMDIALEIDNADEEYLLALELEDAVAEATITAAPSKPRNKRKSRKTQSNTQSKGKTMKNHEILAAFISANPGVTRAVVFDDAGLQASLRSPAQVTAIAAGDKMETKRWNSCINRFIRKIRRDGTDIRVNGQGKTATYTIGSPDGQLVLPFDEAAEAHNAAIIGDDANEVVEAPVPPKQDAMRLVEEPNQSLDFEALLATLDDEAATVTSDDQEAFEAAQKMLK